MTPKERAAMQMALDALENYGIEGTKSVGGIKCTEAIIALREALEQPPCPNGCDTSKGRCADCPDPVIEQPDDLDWITPEAVFAAKLKLHGIDNPAEQPVKQEPVAKYCGYCNSTPCMCQKIYEAANTTNAAPVQPVKQEPVAWVSLIGQYAHISWGSQRPDDEIHRTPLYAAPMHHVDNYYLEQMAECAAAIRGLK